MKFDPTLRAARLVHNLITGREAERFAAQQTIETRPQEIDVPELRRRLLAALREFPPGKEEVEEDQNIALTRSWLLSALGRISNDDPEAAAVVRKHLDPAHEPKRYVRGWTLASLVAANASDLVELARQTVQREEENWVRQLGLAILAAHSPDADEADNARAEIVVALNNADNPSLREDTARAARIVYLPGAVKSLCGIVAEGKYSDVTHEAIIALGNMPASARHVETAARALTRFIAENRNSSRRDAMRTKAIIALGNLKVESTAPILIEELSDDNPAVVRAAARALQSVLGVRTAAARVVEAAGKGEPEQVYHLASALRWMNRNDVVEALEEKMLSGPPKEQETARMLLSEMGGSAALQKLRAQTSVMEEYRDTQQKSDARVRDLFESSIKEARSGFRIAAVMDVIVFAAGILLILASAALALRNTGDLSTWAGIGVTGGAGVLGILYSLLVAKPRQRVRETVDHLMQLKIVFLGYLRQLHQADQAYTRRLLEDDPLSTEEVAAFSDIIEETIHDALAELANAARPPETHPHNES